MESRITVSTVPVSVSLCLALVGGLFWVGGAVMQVTSPLGPDAIHTIKFVDHGVTLYISPIADLLPKIGFPLVGICTAFNFLHLSYMSRRTGLSWGMMLSQFRFFSKITVEKGDSVL